MNKIFQTGKKKKKADFETFFINMLKNNLYKKDSL